ncbi:hypothetical protein HPB50_013958 [Hyalomma asiaticum]|uniref:Uncharacterized protein n=1 Tax=Hyalomma asiaticum TaxID=266040 RepID=A0ACB7S1E2_HYAAI|nr:hypothetical protein HPB50_013958 [Hyalomma asiaticum]
MAVGSSRALAAGGKARCGRPGWRWGVDCRQLAQHRLAEPTERASARAFNSGPAISHAVITPLSAVAEHPSAASDRGRGRGKKTDSASFARGRAPRCRDSSRADTDVNVYTTAPRERRDGRGWAFYVI